MSLLSVNLLSEKLLLAVKMQEETISWETSLQHISLEQVKKDLDSDDAKKAFWINIYNSFFLILRKSKGLTKPGIYRNKEILIAGKKWSLDDIEHGILRKYRYKFSLGYLPNLFAPKLIKDLAVSKIDYRIHFALNCGAKSCPPIAFYSAERIDQQLEMATLSFLEGETKVFKDRKEIHISKLFQWFKGDFGGNKGIRKILKEKLNLDSEGSRLVYLDYSWEESLDNFAGDTF